VSLEGKVALITGAGRGQGRAHAQTLAAHGAEIIALDICKDIGAAPYPMSNSNDLDETAAAVEALGRRVITVQADVRSQDDLDGAVHAGLAEFGHIDILIANAGIWATSPFWEISESHWKEMIDTNQSGVWRTCKAVAPHMIERRTGAIVITSSVNGIEPGAGYAHYASSKHGVIGLMKNIALELAPYGIRCNAICPSTVDTPMANWQGAYDAVAGHAGGTREEFLQGSKAWHALSGRGALDPQFMANAALWLVSDQAAVITGVSLPVDGGHLLLTGINPNPS
jgi:SDR family mycofactocin-dependent oxidoreductase